MSEQVITPLSNVDAAWLKMEDPTNMMMVTGVLTFPRPLDMAYLRGLIETRLLQFERFRQRVVRPRLPFAPDYWEFDPHFNVNAHLHRIGLPHPRDKATLEQLVSDLMSTSLDFSKPLWQMHVVDGYSPDGRTDGGALIVRLHHAMADGMALVGVLLALTEMVPEALPPVAPANGTPPEREEVPGNLTGWWEALQMRSACACCWKLASACCPRSRVGTAGTPRFAWSSIRSMDRPTALGACRRMGQACVPSTLMGPSPRWWRTFPSGRRMRRDAATAPRRTASH